MNARTSAVYVVRKYVSLEGATDTLKSGWRERHMRALLKTDSFGRAVVEMVRNLARYADAHYREYESVIGEDSVIGEAWAQSLRGVRALLNGELNGIDSGAIDGAICALAENEGVTL